MFWVAFGITLSIFALLLGTRFLTSLLSTGEYGKLALSMSLASFAVQISGNSIGQTLTRFYSPWLEAGKLNGLVKESAKRILLTIGIIFLICVLVTLTGNFIGRSPDLYLSSMTGLFAALLIVNRVALGLEDAARERRFRGMIQGVFEIGRFLLAIGLILILSEKNARAALGGFSAAAAVIVIIHIVFIYKHVKKIAENKSIVRVKIRPEDRSSLKRFQYPLIMSNAFMWLIMMAERWMLLKYGNLSDVGGYTAVYQLAFVPMLFVSSFLILLTEPMLYQIVGLDKKNFTASKAMKINLGSSMAVMLITLVVVCILFLFHSHISLLFLGPEFRSYSWLFPWLALAGGCFATAQQLLLKLSCEMETKKLAMLWGVVAVLAVFSYFIGAVYLQIKGIVIAVVVVNVVLLIFSMANMRSGEK